MSTNTITQPDRTRPPDRDNRRSAKIGKRIAAAVVGLAAVGGVAVGVGAMGSSSSPAPARALPQPAISSDVPQTTQVSPGCLADAECYGESLGVPQRGPAPDRQPPAEGAFAWCMRGRDCPALGPQTPAPDEDAPSYMPHG